MINKTWFSEHSVAPSPPASLPPSPASTQNTAPFEDLRVFWGPEIVRLEYVLYLMETGRIMGDVDRRGGG